MTQLSYYRKTKFNLKIKELLNRSHKFVDYSSHDSIQQHLTKKDSMNEIINELAIMSAKYNGFGLCVRWRLKPQILN